MLFETFGGNVATGYGIAREEMAKEPEKVLGQKVESRVYLLIQMYHFWRHLLTVLLK